MNGDWLRCHSERGLDDFLGQLSGLSCRRIAKYDHAKPSRRIDKDSGAIAAGHAVVEAGDIVTGNVPSQPDANLARLAVSGFPGLVNCRNDGTLVLAQRSF